MGLLSTRMKSHIPLIKYNRIGIIGDFLRFDYYVFDFDGTIAETGEGIRRSVARALERMGRTVPGREVLDRFIGPPLHDAFMEYCGLSEDEADRAIALYRERYVDVGLYESHVYDGISALLEALRRRGAYAAIASAKPQFMVERLSAHFGIDRYLNAIAGIGMERHSADKCDLILQALPEGADLSRACMVGDRRYDIEAGKALGMYAVGADYGYSLPGELAAAGADEVFGSVAEMSEWMLEERRP